MAKTKDKKDAPIKMPSVDYHPEYSHPSLGVRPVSWEEAQRHGHRMPTLKEMYTYIKGVFGGKTPPEKPPYREMPPVDYHPEDSPPSLGVRPARKSYDSQKHKKKRGNEGGLENGVVSSIIAIAGVLAGIFFLSPNLTGNAIADLSTKTSSLIGAALLVVGLVAGFFWVKAKKK